MTRKPWSHVRILIYRMWAIMPTVARKMESPLIFNPNRTRKGPFSFFLSEPLLTQGLVNPTHPQQLSTRLLDLSVLTRRST